MAQSSNDSLRLRETKELQELLGRDQHQFKTWWTGWLVGYSLATAVQTGIGIATSNHSLRQDMFLGAGTTLLGAAGQMITPMVDVDPGIYFNLQNTTDDALIKRKAEILDALERSAHREALGRSFATHATAGAVNLASGLITWIGFKRTPREGLVNFLLNTAITEAQIWSQPVKARKYLLQNGGNHGTSFLPQDIQWMASVSAGGVSLKVRF